MTDDPITTEEYFRGALKVIAHWSEVDLSGEWESGLRGVIRSITDMAREVLSAHPEKPAGCNPCSWPNCGCQYNPGAAKAEPKTVAADLDGGDARPNRRLDSSDRGLIQQLREMATEFAIDNKTDCKQHVCWIAADRISDALAQPEQEPVAFVPVHPRNGPLWSDTYATTSFSERSPNYPRMALYASQPPAAPVESPLCRCHLMDNSCEIHGAGKAPRQSSAETSGQEG